MDTHVLVVDDDPEFLLSLKVGLQRYCRLTTAQTLKEASIILEANSVDVLLLDITFGPESGLEALKRFRERHPCLDIVIVSGHRDPKMVVEAIRQGACDYLVKPFEIDELIAVIEKLKPLQLMRERNAALVEGMNPPSDLLMMIGEAPALKAVLDRISQLKGHLVPLLIEGESGTGKELLARRIHSQEKDPRRPFIAVNCAAIPGELLESELFGHEKGSFTGAHCRKIGRFELANGGDLFLDEISSLKWDLQAKILRALQEKEITRVGGTQVIRIDFRVIAATNENLEKLVEEAKFRRDLYHRLKVISLKMPALRERPTDIPLLVTSFLRKHDSQGKRRLSSKAMATLVSYPWPGNVRELENLIQSLVILVPQPEIGEEDLPEWVFRKNGGEMGALSVNDFLLPRDRGDVVSLKKYVSVAERAYIERALEITRGDKSKAASLLNISRTRLYERLKVWDKGEQ